jgi:hypothetical protein
VTREQEELDEIVEIDEGSFSTVQVGKKFRFNSEKTMNFGAKGPWIKTGDNSYKHADDKIHANAYGNKDLTLKRVQHGVMHEGVGEDKEAPGTNKGLTDTDMANVKSVGTSKKKTQVDVNPILGNQKPPFKEDVNLDERSMDDEGRDFHRGEMEHHFKVWQTAAQDRRQNGPFGAATYHKKKYEEHKKEWNKLDKRPVYEGQTDQLDENDKAAIEKHSKEAAGHNRAWKKLLRGGTVMGKDKAQWHKKKEQEHRTALDGLMKKQYAKEETEQLDELGPKTLTNYAKRSANEIAGKAAAYAQSREREGPSPSQKSLSWAHKATKRVQGVHKAVDRLGGTFKTGKFRDERKDYKLEDILSPEEMARVDEIDSMHEGHGAFKWGYHGGGGDPQDNDRKYKIVRMYKSGHPTKTIKKNVTLSQAQAHAQHPETSSSTAKSANAKKHTQRHGDWFDGYDKQ